MTSVWEDGQSAGGNVKFHLLWKTVWIFIKWLNIFHRNTCTPTFAATPARKWNDSRYPSTDEWLEKIHTKSDATTTLNEIHQGSERQGHRLSLIQELLLC